MFHVVCTPGHFSEFNTIFLLCLTKYSLQIIFFVRNPFFVRIYECSQAVEYIFRKGSYMYEFFS